METTTNPASLFIAHSIILCMILFTPAFITLVILRIIWGKIKDMPFVLAAVSALFGGWLLVRSAPRVAQATRDSYRGVRNVFEAAPQRMPRHAAGLTDAVLVHPETGEVFDDPRGRVRFQ